MGGCGAILAGVVVAFTDCVHEVCFKFQDRVTNERQKMAVKRSVENFDPCHRASRPGSHALGIRKLPFTTVEKWTLGAVVGETPVEVVRFLSVFVYYRGCYNVDRYVSLLFPSVGTQ
jgi:hypothetical protein